MSDLLKDPIDLHEQVRKAQANAADLEERFHRLTRKVFSTASGREWLAAAMARANFMGSVFDAEFNATAAAYRDGVRSVFSEILNSAALGAANHDPDEEP